MKPEEQKADFWVFGYGSLIWRPGFEFICEQKAVLYGRHRALCIYSWVHRGTRQKPGLVLGLDRGGACAGVARLVEAKNRQAVIAYLREREMVTDVYVEKWVKIRLADRQSDDGFVDALTYVADRNSQQYAGRLDFEQLVALTKKSEGASGKNSEYVKNTAASLAKWGIRDHGLERIARML